MDKSKAPLIVYIYENDTGLCSLTKKGNIQAPEKDLDYAKSCNEMDC
jgi:hypothetical protein